jgi:hypothetical protein
MLGNIIGWETLEETRRSRLISAEMAMREIESEFVKMMGNLLFSCIIICDWRRIQILEATN